MIVFYINVNLEDLYGRRPIHLAISLGCVDAVQLLIQADCALCGGPGNASLLHYLPKNEEVDSKEMLRVIVPALADRYSRLLNMAQEHLPPSKLSNLNIEKGPIKELHVSQLNDLFISVTIEHNTSSVESTLPIRRIQCSNVLVSTIQQYQKAIVSPIIQTCRRTLA